MNLILASASPRRKALLEQIGVQCQVSPVDICEVPLAGEAASTYVERLAIEKARCCFKLGSEESVVLGADTTVVVDGVIMGKPEDQEDAIRTLLSLSGRTHQVITAVAVVTAEQTQSVVVETDVRFKSLTREECLAYWCTGEPADKAGSYGIQGYGAIFVEEIKGSYSAVVGLPLAETAAMLKQVDVPVWQSEQDKG
ncbi:nucleoside triphosphate pyrophosphatase [uncultured Neptuniibacter sp.]|uniref:Maf family protein n=1 Tax=uncultured Neptuniibacter sp. TaxID=502143 RepID=UPI00262719BA|nr:Maf family protein [uncultured Neptuniibacter sp.]